MRRMQTIEKVIGENTFYIRPFGAFAAANISGELAALLSPILAGIAPLFGGLDTGDGGSDAVANPLDMDIEEAMPAISSALSTISGDKVERMMRRLLIDQQNISVQGEDTDGNTVILDKDLADEVFCGELQDMFILCYEVKGFFQESRNPIWQPYRQAAEGDSDIRKWGDFDFGRFSELELRMYSLIKAGIATKSELDEAYTLDEALKLYALYSMDRDIERFQAEEMQAEMGR